MQPCACAAAASRAPLHLTRLFRACAQRFALAHRATLARCTGWRAQLGLWGREMPVCGYRFCVWWDVEGHASKAGESCEVQGGVQGGRSSCLERARVLFCLAWLARGFAPTPVRKHPCAQVDVYSFAMICYQLFECVPPFWWQDPIEAARGAAMQHKRPTWGAVNRAKVVVRASKVLHLCPPACVLVPPWSCAGARNSFFLFYTKGCARPPARLACTCLAPCVAFGEGSSCRSCNVAVRRASSSLHAFFTALNVHSQGRARTQRNRCVMLSLPLQLTAFATDV